MYELYSQQRAGRPRWTLGASAVVLLLMVGLAAAVIQHKKRALLSTLTEPTVIERGRLRCRLPAGWELVTDKLPQGIVLSAKEPEENRSENRLMIFRDSPRPLSSPGEARVALRQQLINLGLLVEAGQTSPRESNIGPYPGWAWESVFSSRMAGGKVITVSRVAMAPGGQIVGLILFITGDVNPRDLRLVDQIAASIELLDALPAPDAAEFMKQIGIQFDLPAEATVFRDGLPTAQSLQIAGGGSQQPWFLTGYRVPLLPGRTPESLVRDLALTMLNELELPHELNTKPIDGRARAQFVLASATTKAALLFSCTQTDDNTALLLMGSSDRASLGALTEFAEFMAGSSKVAPYREQLDLEKAREWARAWIEETSQRGLSSAWQDDPTRADYVIAAPAIVLGAELRTLSSQQRSGAAWWKVHSDFKLDYSNPIRHVVEDYLLRDDGRAFEYISTMTGGAGPVRYVEKWTGESTVHRELALPDRPPEKIETKVNELYLCEPALIEAAAQLAKTSGPGALFTTTQAFTKGLAYWVVTSLGVQPLPGDGDGKASVAMLQRDFDPSPIVLYFDQHSALIGLQLADGEYRIRSPGPTQGGVTE